MAKKCLEKQIKECAYFCLMVEMDLALGTGYHLKGENSHLINACKGIMDI